MALPTTLETLKGLRNQQALGYGNCNHPIILIVMSHNSITPMVDTYPNDPNGPTLIVGLEHFLFSISWE